MATDISTQNDYHNPRGLYQGLFKCTAAGVLVHKYIIVTSYIGMHAGVEFTNAEIIIKQLCMNNNVHTQSYHLI